MNEAKQIKAAWNKWRRETRLASFGGRKVKAWSVPGTQEAGRDEMWRAEYNRTLEREKRLNPNEREGN